MIVEELWGARLYTGPLFVKYNGVLRGISSRVPFLVSTFQTLCQGNQYTTCVADWLRTSQTAGHVTDEPCHFPPRRLRRTLHVINSTIVKLGKLMTAEKVYRGISGATLPDNFWRPNEFKVRGGVEFGFMSTTLNGEVAMDYAAGGGAGIIFEIQQGMVDRGADLSWLSQYPHEKEILFAPLTGIEVQQTRVVNNVVCRAAARTIDEQGLGLSATHIFGLRHGLARRQRAPQRESERVDDRAGRLEAAEDARRSGARAPD